MSTKGPFYVSAIVEPDGEGFNNSFNLSKHLLKINNLDENRIVNASGEIIPFSDNTFDIVYSTNVLEHVNDPLQTIDEAIRVLKPGGIAQFTYPNYHSFFDGHYAVFHPPIISNRVFQWWVKVICRRNPAFAKTLRTELNVKWTKKTINQLKLKYNISTHTKPQHHGTYLKSRHHIHGNNPLAN